LGFELLELDGLLVELLLLRLQPLLHRLHLPP
jgi:hypothetical protein